ncbi:MAG: hypothetical protein AAFV80_06335 [Bacteroidota bacterium]
MIRALCEQGEVLVYDHQLVVGDQEEQQVIHYLEAEYRRQSKFYVGTLPNFDSEAALWAAETVYLSAQLILHRKTEAYHLPKLLMAFEGPVHPGSVLSVDLVFRFLPDLIQELEKLSDEDPLVPILQQRLQEWPFSGIRYLNTWPDDDLSVLFQEKGLRLQLIDRLVKYKNHRLLTDSKIRTLVEAEFGWYAEAFWPGYSLIK